jgi:hypothetical protein
MLHDHKSLEGLPADRAGMMHLMAHAVRMGAMGLKSERQVEDVRKYLISRALETMPPGEFDHLRASGLLDQLQAAAGGDDGEDAQDAKRRQHGETVSALVHFLGCSAGSGHCSHEQALEQIKPHLGDLPEGVSARDIVGSRSIAGPDQTRLCRPPSANVVSDLRLVLSAESKAGGWLLGTLGLAHSASDRGADRPRADDRSALDLAAQDARAERLVRAVILKSLHNLRWQRSCP